MSVGKALGIAAAAFMVAACLHATEPNPNQKAHDVGQLADVLPLLSELEVHDWRDQDWCRNINYSGGQFSTNNEESTCNLFEGAAEAFTEGATADFERVRRGLAESGVSVYMVSVWDADAGHGRAVVFDLGSAGMFDRWSYVYEPGYALPEALPNEWVATPIDADWYFVWEDWN